MLNIVRVCARVRMDFSGMAGEELAATMAKRQAVLNAKNNSVFLEVCYFEMCVILAIFVNSLFLAAYHLTPANHSSLQRSVI
eukprot:COSAG05_NODE_2340_length_3209_cov_18.437727_2_plen_82_part_00